MLYSIIPPTLIVLSLFGIVILLVKKAPAAADLQNRLSPRDKTGEDFSDQNVSRSRLRRMERIIRPIILLPEKIGQGLKFVFLKLVAMIIRRSKRKKEQKEKERVALAEQAKERAGTRAEKREMKTVEFSSTVETRIERPTRAQKTKEKKDAFEKILIERIALNPKDIEAYERLGEYYLEIENWNYAKECFKQVLRLNPGNGGVKRKMKKLERILGKE